MGASPRLQAAPRISQRCGVPPEPGCHKSCSPKGSLEMSICPKRCLVSALDVNRTGGNKVQLTKRDPNAPQPLLSTVSSFEVSFCTAIHPLPIMTKASPAHKREHHRRETITRLSYLFNIPPLLRMALPSYGILRQLLLEAQRQVCPILSWSRKPCSNSNLMMDWVFERNALPALLRGKNNLTFAKELEAGPTWAPAGKRSSLLFAEFPPRSL